MLWDYKHEEPAFDEIPNGPHRLRIREVNKKISKNGNDMLELKFDVSGHTSLLFYYIVFLPDRPEKTNRNLTAFFDSFGIDEGDFNMHNWVGKVGAGMVKHDEEDRAKIGYLVRRNKQDDLPGWKEPGSGKKVPGGADFAPMPAGDDEDLPF